uniref:Uncharacterized protein n=1 Tax=Anopheles coluzzii TaxID=1518534 RepID=A0A8W7Q1I2_ANOCL
MIAKSSSNKRTLYARPAACAGRLVVGRSSSPSVSSTTSSESSLLMLECTVSYSKHSSSITCGDPSTNDANRTGSLNLIIVVHCLHSGLRQYSRRSFSARSVSIRPCSSNSSTVSNRRLPGYRLRNRLRTQRSAFNGVA